MASSRSGEVVSIDPRTGQTVEVVAPETTTEEVAALCEAALAAAYPHEPWVEHFDWLYPLFNERLETRAGRMYISDRPGLGITLTDQARAWTVDRAVIDARS